MGILVLAYSVAAYALFFATFLYLVLFVGADVTAFAGAPKTLDHGVAWIVFAPAPLQNLLLIVLFGVSHSVMARPGFKAVWTKIVPWPAERATYVLVSSLILLLTYACWQPMPQVVWSMSGAWETLIIALFYGGFATALVATFLISHFDLFGLKQAWEHWRGATPGHEPFRTPMLYKITRHPIYLGFTIAFWAAPTMTVGHLLFASTMTIYALVGIGYEERDLLARFGDEYVRYMSRVPMLFPIGRRKS